jgi:hypothetical protein
MRTNALGFCLMVVGVGAYLGGCGSSNDGGTGGNGGTGSGGHGGAGSGGHGTGGAVVGTGGRDAGGTDTIVDVAPGTGGHDTTDAALDVPAGTGGVSGTGGHDGGTIDALGTGGVSGTGGHDGGTIDAPGTGGVSGTGGSDAGTGAGGADAGDAGTHATLTQVEAIFTNITTPTADMAPGCIHCHDGIAPNTDGGAATTLPHVLNFSTTTTTYADLVNVASIRCAGADGGTALKRVNPGSADTSALISKLRAGSGFTGTACDGVGMPLNPPPVDGGTTTHYMITQAQLDTITDWVNAGALNN